MKKSKLVCIVWAACAAVLAMTSATAAPTTAGNLLISDLSTGTLTEYTPQGAPVQLLYTSQYHENDSGLRDIVQGKDGRIHMFEGTFLPRLASLNPESGNASFLSMPGWSIINNGTFGGIAVYNDYVFVTDMSTAYGGEKNGVIRFDLGSGSSIRYDFFEALGGDFSELTLGLNGLLYAISDFGGLYVFDPETFTLLSHLPNVANLRGIAVDQAGSIYGADWGGSVSKFDSSGQLVKSVNLVMPLSDIDIDSAGRLVIGGGYGRVFVTDTSLDDVASFDIGEYYRGGTLHVAFTQDQQSVPEPSTLALAIIGLASLNARKKRENT